MSYYIHTYIYIYISHLTRPLGTQSRFQGITKPAIRRLARRGGVKRISGLIYEDRIRSWSDPPVSQTLQRDPMKTSWDVIKAMSCCNICNVQPIIFPTKFRPKTRVQWDGAVPRIGTQKIFWFPNGPLLSCFSIGAQKSQTTPVLGITHVWLILALSRRQGVFWRRSWRMFCVIRPILSKVI